MAVERAKYEGIDKHDRLKNPDDHFYNNLDAYAMFKCAYYQCYNCKEPYFGGLNDCENDALRAADTNIKDLICGKCVAEINGNAGITKCEKHGTKYIDFKCRYCCSVALFFCGGKTHYCDSCHNDAIAKRLKNKDCHGKDCPLGVKHPPAGSEFALGCGLCRSQKFIKQ